MIRIGIVGAGGMGNYHGRCIKRIEGAQVVAVADIIPDRADKLAGEHGARAYYAMEDLFADPGVDVVLVCVPSYLHARAVVGAAAAGKHVVTEKPVALTLEEVDQERAAVAAAGVKAMVAQVCRFMSHYALIVDYYRRGELGKPITAVAARMGRLPAWGSWFRDPKLSGGALLDLHIHDLDYLYYLFGQPKTVYALGVRDDAGAWNQVHTSLDYGTHRATAEASFFVPRGGSFQATFRLFCEKGGAMYPYRMQGPVDPQAAASARSDLALFLDQDEPICPPLSDKDPYQAEMEYFLERVAQDRPVELATLDQARDVLAIAMAVRRSLESGQVVSLCAT